MKSVLVVPAHDERKAKACRRFGADIILWDLEDSVPDDEYERALEMLPDYFEAGDHVRLRFRETKILERLGTVTPWFPKVEERPRYAFPYVALIESPAGVAFLRRLDSLPMSGLAFGRDDFMAAMGIQDTLSPVVQLARAEISMIAKAFGCWSSDSPCTLRDAMSAGADIREAMAMGFDSKGVVFPEHVGLFGRRDVQSRAEAILEGDEGGCREVGGEMIGPPHVRWARENFGAD